MKDFQAALQLVMNEEVLNRVFSSFHGIKHENQQTEGYVEEADKIKKFNVIKAALKTGVEKKEITAMVESAIESACKTLKERLSIVARMALK